MDLGVPRIHGSVGVSSNHPGLVKTALVVGVHARRIRSCIASRVTPGDLDRPDETWRRRPGYQWLEPSCTSTRAPTYLIGAPSPSE